MVDCMNSFTGFLNTGCLLSFSLGMLVSSGLIGVIYAIIDPEPKKPGLTQEQYDALIREALS